MAKSEKKALTALVRTVLLVMTVLCALVITGCPNMAEDDDLGGGSNSGSGNSGSGNSGGGNSGSGNSGGGSGSTSKYAVEFVVDGANGTLTAEVDGKPVASGNKVEKDKSVTFTASPNENFIVDKWTITGGTFESGTGQAGSPGAKVRVTAAVKVTVSFKLPVYTKVRYAELEAYLNKASDTDINYIEITGIKAADLCKGYWKTAPLGETIKKAANKGARPKLIALKLPARVAGLTDMASCFQGCTNLVSVENIPEGVTDLLGCFKNCTSLTKAPVIPASVTNMKACFNGCNVLIQAPVIPANVINMDICFQHCTGLTKAPAIPAKVESMADCFKGCTSLTQVPAIPASVTNMSSCFSGCTSLIQGPDIPASVTDMRWCFQKCTSLERVKLNCSYNEEDVDNKPAFTKTFTDCTALKDGGIQVESAYYAEYTEKQAIDIMEVPGKTDKDKKAKFSEF